MAAKPVKFSGKAKTTKSGKPRKKGPGRADVAALRAHYGR